MKVDMTDEEYLLRAECNRLEGYSNAVNHYGIWKDGVQTIGCMETLVVDLERNLQKQRDEIMAKIKQSFK